MCYLDHFSNVCFIWICSDFGDQITCQVIFLKWTMLYTWPAVLTAKINIDAYSQLCETEAYFGLLTCE